jgi:hypothetical protein
MYLLDEYKIAYHANVHVAGRATGELILGLGGRMVRDHHYSEPAPAGYRSFCTIRPHWEVFASEAVSHNETAEDYIERSWEYPGFQQDGEIFWRRHLCEKVLYYSSIILYDVIGLLQEWGVPRHRLPLGMMVVDEADKERPPLRLRERDLFIIHSRFGPEILDLFCGQELLDAQV